MLPAKLSRSIYFSLHRLIGSQLATHYKEFLALEGQSAAQVAQLRDERLSKLIVHASTNVPFYQQRVPARTSLQLSDFPILTKEDIRLDFQNLMSPHVRLEYGSGKSQRAYSWLPVQTGGSTGMPTTVIHDWEFRDFNRSARLYTQHLCGFPIGVPYFKLWGSMREINDAKGSRQQRVASFLAGEIIFNAFKMDDTEIDSYVETINKSSVEHMMAYSDAAYQMAKHILESGRPIRALKSVMACAGTLTQEMRGTISRAFGGARVQNLYGSRDCGAMACECRQGSFHVFENKVLLETVGQQGQAVPAGQPGRILVTLLSNYGFPLIRYDIGDVGVFSEKACTCGIPTRLLERLEGRSIEFFVTASGGYISPIYFRHLIGVVHNPGVIRRFQIVQYAQDRVVLSLEKESGAAETAIGSAVENIRRDLMTVFGPKMSLQIDFVSRIEESTSGKFISSVNKMGQC